MSWKLTVLYCPNLPTTIICHPNLSFQQVKIYLMFIARDVGILIISILTESRKSVTVKPNMMPLP
jgi:hypothetical protein